MAEEQDKKKEVKDLQPEKDAKGGGGRGTLGGEDALGGKWGTTNTTGGGSAAGGGEDALGGRGAV